MADERQLLCLNSGSSSLKFAVYRLGGAETRLAAGAVERIGSAAGRLWIRNAGGERHTDVTGGFPDASAAVRAALNALASAGLARFDGAGHRIVHGGPEHSAPERVDSHVLTTLRGLVPFAPLHLPAAIEGIEVVAEQFPGLPQVVCFDTAFHRRMPEVARRLPLPRALWDAGIRRYGFHGLSYEYIVETIGAAALGRAVIAHLGNGASMAAVHGGQSVDTTMGFTPTGGFMMATRSGDLDPGVLLYLIRHRGYDAAALERLVDHEAGLLGVSGISGDMQTLLPQRDRAPHAAEAVEMFCYHARQHIGQLAAVLNGLDTLVFTGGIGEHAAVIRWDICAGLTHLGIRLDPARNDLHAAVISEPEGSCTVRVVATDEDLMIARHTYRLLASGPV